MAFFCVFGNPIKHSLSPIIHERFAKQLGHQLEYRRELVSAGRFASTVASLFSQGLAGANVTLPYKGEAFKLATQHTAAAKLGEAVNTLIPQPFGGLLGANTDGLGLLYDLQRQQVDLTGQRVLILGAGGAVRGVLTALVDANPELIWIANRTPEKAEQLASRYDKVRVFASQQAPASVDIIINATSASLSGQIPKVSDGLLSSAQFIYDMVYAPQATPFLRFASAHSEARLSDGLGMLVGQAAASYQLWWQSEKPNMTTVVNALRQQWA